MPVLTSRARAQRAPGYTPRYADWNGRRAAIHTASYRTPAAADARVTRLTRAGRTAYVIGYGTQRPASAVYIVYYW